MMIGKKQIEQIEHWLIQNARPLEISKWNFIWNRITEEEFIKELVKYQNLDGGFGNGFESDIITPESSSIASAEAIFTAYEYGLDLRAEWAKKLMEWFEKTAGNTPSFWEMVPPSIEEYPHAPWWSYRPDTEFTPNPCAIVSSMLLRFGTDSQKVLGEKIAKRCIDFLLSDESYQNHDTYCLQRLFKVLAEDNSSLITPEIAEAMEQRIIKGVCRDSEKWMEYVAQPLDLVDSNESIWYEILEESILDNLDYWEDTLTGDGYWNPNFDWGMDTEEAHEATKCWRGYLAVKRVKILKSFGRIG